MITSPEYLAARAYHVAAHPLQTLDRINVNGADVLNGVMGIADQIRNKEYGALARGGGYVAGSVAQVYLLRKGAQKCGDWIDTKTYKPESFAKFMSPEDAKAYLKFLEQGSTAGLTDAELLGIQKVDDALALNKLDYGSPVILQNSQIYIEGGSSAKGLLGHDFEDYLTKNMGGDGSFSVSGRDFDGGVGNRWWEAKSGNYWNMLEEKPNELAKFKSDMGARLKIATENGASYELFSNTSIPESIKEWLTKKGIPFTEILE